MILTGVMPAAAAPHLAGPGGFTGAVPLVGVGSLLQPGAVALNPSGNQLYIADTGHDRIQRFSAGIVVTLQAVWGSAGSGPGQLNAPGGIAVDGAGHVFVADTGNNRIEEYTSDGTFVAQFGGRGSGSGKLNGPTGLAVDHLGNLFVADTGNNRIQRRSTNGVWSVVGPASAPRGVAVDAIGLAYVANTGANEIDVMASNGTIITSWNTGNGPLNSPTGIALDGSGKVFVTDAGNNRVIESDTAGRVENTWGTSGSAGSQFNAPASVAVSGTLVYVADPGNNRVQQFVLVPTPGPTPPSVLATFAVQPPSGSGADNFAVGPDGSFVVAESNCTVARYDPLGHFLGRFGSQGSGPGQFCGIFTSPADLWYPSAVIDGSGNIVISDDGTKAHRVQIFNPSGGFIRQWPGDLVGLEVSGNDHFWATNAATKSGECELLDENGGVIATFQPNTPNHGPVEIDPLTGDRIIASGYDQRIGAFTTIERYNTQGDLLARVTGLVFNDLAYDPRGNLVALDAVDHEMRWLNATFKPLVSWAIPSTGLVGPVGVDAAGNLYVYHSGSGGTETILKFEPLQVPTPPPPLYMRSLGLAGASRGISSTDPEQQVAIGPNGSATVAWEVVDSSYHFTVWEATRPAGASAFGSPRPIETKPIDKTYDELPAVATGPDGTTTIVWEVWDGTHYRLWQATRRSGAANFRPPGPLETNAVSDLPEYPSVAIGAGGETTVAWVVHSVVRFGVRAATRASAAAAFSQAPLTDKAFPGMISPGVTVAIGSDGRSTVAWSATAGSRYEVWEATKTAKAKVFGSPLRIDSAAAAPITADLPQIVTGGDGVTTIAFTRGASDGSPRVWVAMRPAGASGFSPPVQVEPTTLGGPRARSAEHLQVAAGPDGTTTVAWQVRGSAGWSVWTATRLKGARTFAAPVRVGSAGDTGVSVAVGPGGGAAVVWQVVRGPVEAVEVAERQRAGGSFTSPFQLVPGLTATDPSGPNPHVAAGAGGAVTVVWSSADQQYNNQTVWEDSTTIK